MALWASILVWFSEGWKASISRLIPVQGSVVIRSGEELVWLLMMLAIMVRNMALNHFHDHAGDDTQKRTEEPEPHQIMWT